MVCVKTLTFKGASILTNSSHYFDDWSNHSAWLCYFYYMLYNDCSPCENFSSFKAFNWGPISDARIKCLEWITPISFSWVWIRIIFVHILHTHNLHFEILILRWISNIAFLLLINILSKICFQSILISTYYRLFTHPIWFTKMRPLWVPWAI